ncbi:MAG: hypothetical protein IJ946_03985 [Clostridia bacterium]|nr:hypothetical protein [Clostridia bacterium]
MEKIINATEYTYTGMRKSIYALKEKYDFLESFNIGQSCMGRDIPALKIGSGPYCLLTGGFWGDDVKSANILLMLTEEMCRCLKGNLPFCGVDLNKALKGRGIIIVPRVNPDGVEISLCGAAAAGSTANEIRKLLKNSDKWRANLRGVQIDCNFSSGWYGLKETLNAQGIFAPRPMGYMGPFPESEPETVALISLAQKYNIKHSLSFFGGDGVIYWQYGEKSVKNSEKMVSLLSRYSGYRATPVGSNSKGGGFKDWFIESLDRPAFNIHLESGEAAELYENLRKMLLVSVLM